MPKFWIALIISMIICSVKALLSTTSRLNRIPKAFPDPNCNRKYIFRRNLSNSFSVLMNTPIVAKGLADIADGYDVFFLDQFGVLHNGVEPLEGVVTALDKLHERRKISIVLSNSSSRSDRARRKFSRMGLPTTYSAFLTSGELAWHYMKEKNMKGMKCTWITWNGHHRDDFVTSLGIQLSEIEEADFLLLGGTQAIATSAVESEASSTSLELFDTGIIDDALQHVLSVAAERGLPAICANDDMLAVSKDQLAHMPGKIKQAYQEMGGQVISFGKPSKTMFDTAIAAAEMALLQQQEQQQEQQAREEATADSLEILDAPTITEQATQATVRSLLAVEAETAAADTEMNLGVQSSLSLSSSKQEEVQKKFILKRPRRLKYIHVGDSLHHDVAGAHHAGIDSLFITSKGVHKEQLMEEEEEEEEGSDGDVINNYNDANINDDGMIIHPSIISSHNATANDVQIQEGPCKTTGSNRKPLLMKVCDLCDLEAIKRPTYVLRNFEW